MKQLHAILLLFVVSMAPAFADAMSDARDILDRYTRAERPAGPSKSDPYDRAMDELVSETVRFHAACLLTEFKDTSGLPLLRDKLGQIRKTDPETDINYYRDAELLFAAFERCTGKSMGKTPLDPSLSGSMTGAAAAREYQALLNAWDEWWKTANSVR